MCALPLAVWDVQHKLCSDLWLCLYSLVHVLHLLLLVLLLSQV